MTVEKWGADRCRTCRHAFTTGKDRFYCKKSLADKGDCTEYIAKIPPVKQESCRDIEEIREVISCDADAETKCKMISNILSSKPYYFEKQEPILDKIRAEITEYAIPDFEYHGCGGSQKIVELEDVLEIIDKYRGEEDGKNNL